MEPSDFINGHNDPILCTMIVSGSLKIYLVILHFFDPYHTLAMLCKLKNLGNLAFLESLIRANYAKNAQKTAKSGIRPFCAGATAHTKNRKFLKSPKICSFEPKILIFFVFFRFFRNFFQPKYVFFGFLQ